MNYLQVLKILISEKVLKNPKIKQLSSGNNYQTFLINEARDKYVLRLLNKKASANNRLEKAFVVLRFVEQEKINFAEKAIFFDKKNSFLLSTYISGKELSVSDLRPEQLMEFIKKIVTLRNLSFSKFVNLQNEHKAKFEILENPIDRLSFLKDSRIKYLKANKAILENNGISFSSLSVWINDNFSILQEAYKLKKYEKEDIFFDHGDASGANIILTKDALFFIDWDNAKFTQDLGFSLANLFFSASIFSRKYISSFLSLYLDLANIKMKKGELYQEVTVAFKLIIFSGALWALETLINSCKNEDGEQAKYLDIYQQRVDLYNNFSFIE